MAILKTLDNAGALKELTGLLSKFLGPSVQECGEMLGNRFRLFRIKQEVKLLTKATKILEEAGVTPGAVNLRILFPLLEAAVLEEEESMAERWASLLASAADPNTKLDIEASFIEILKQLAPTHAFLLEVFYEQIERYKVPPEQFTERGVVLRYLKDFLKEKIPQFDVALDNLLRLHLVEYPLVKLGNANGSEVRCPVISDHILCATNLGVAFITACGRGRTPRSDYYSVPGNSVTNVFTPLGTLHLY